MELPDLGLLEQENREKKPAGEPPKRNGAPVSLVEWAGRFCRRSPEKDGKSAPRAARCADGYVRRSPVQPYRVPPEYRRRRRRLAVLVVLILLALVLIVLGIWRNGLLRL